jgi:hypothetical protein
MTPHGVRAMIGGVYQRRTSSGKITNTAFITATWGRLYLADVKQVRAEHDYLRLKNRVELCIRHSKTWIALSLETRTFYRQFSCLMLTNIVTYGLIWALEKDRVIWLRYFKHKG